MVKQGAKKTKYNLNLLRGWQRSQLKLLHEFAIKDLVNQTRISGASGLPPGTHFQQLGGKITALSRAKLIEKVGRDDNGQMVWKLNEDEVDRQHLLDFLKRIDPLTEINENKK